MRLRPSPFALVVLSCIFGLPASAQQASTVVTQNSQAISVLQQSLKTMGGAVPSDSVATGSIQTVAGSQTTQGTVRVLTKGTAQSLVQIETPNTTETCIYSSGQANELSGATVAVLPLELVVTSQAADFP